MSLFVNLLLYSRSYYCLTPSLLDDFFDQVHKTVLWKKGGMRRRSSERLCSRKQQTNATAIVLRWPGSPDSSLVECRTHDSKVASLNPGRSGGRIFFYRVNFVCWLLFGCPFHPHVTNLKTSLKKQASHNAWFIFLCLMRHFLAKHFQAKCSFHSSVCCCGLV